MCSAQYGAVFAKQHDGSDGAMGTVTTEQLFSPFHDKQNSNVGSVRARGTTKIGISIGSLVFLKIKMRGREWGTSKEDNDDIEL